ncbi:MAG: MmcQ/YjbR family DNA-binding protein [Ginsengibacter sp.]
MNIEELRDYVLSLKDVTEGFPFGENTLVYKTNHKIFLLVSITSTPLQFNVKCDPDYAVELRERYECILPGYHMNKKHWNTVIIDGTLTKAQLQQLIKDSHSLVAPKSRKKQ